MNREQMIEAIRKAVDAEYLEIGFRLKPAASRHVAQTILAAIETAGGLIVPKKPDLRMLEAATNRCQDGKCVEWTAMCYGNAIELYDTMLAASPMTPILAVAMGGRG